MPARIMLAVAAAAVIITLVPGCKQKAAEPAEHRVKELVRERQDMKPLEQEADEFVQREFAGQDIAVVAEESREIELGRGREGAVDVNPAMELVSPVFSAVSLIGTKTELRAESAVINPDKKRVVLEGEVRVYGPGGNMLECNRLVWYYERDLLEVDGDFRLVNGRGVTYGTRCRTDIGFTKISVE